MARQINTKEDSGSPSVQFSESISAGRGGNIIYRSALSGWPMIFGWLGMLIFTFHACTHMVAAGDTWVAMASGRHFVNHGVNTVEPFSANSHKPGPTAEEVKTWPGWAQWIVNKVGLDTVKYWHPTGWINQNWLTHVIFYRLTTAFGSPQEPYFNALVFWKFGIYALAAVCMFFTARLLGANAALSAVFTCFAMFIARSFLDVRPAGFSNLMIAVFMLILVMTSYRNYLYIWLLVPAVVFWCNVHGGYIYAFIMIIPFIGWHVLMQFSRRWVLVVCSVATWLVLYGSANRFLSHAYLTPISARNDWVFLLVLFLIAFNIVLGWYSRASFGAFLAYVIAASVLIFLVLLPRYFPEIPPMHPEEKTRFMADVVAARLSYVGTFFFATAVSILIAAFKDRIKTLKPRAVIHVISAAFVAFIAMLVFNPFHLTNLTHTFVISISKYAERWRDVHEWHPAFAWDNPVGTAVPFLVMYIITWCALAAWLVGHILVRRRSNDRKRNRKTATVEAFNLPGTDIILLVIAALTINMAIYSRRFIPSAAFAACPVIAMLIDQTIRAISAVVNRRWNRKLDVPAMPEAWESGFILAGAALVMFFGVLWVLKFNRIYLDFWPADTEYKSIFMRMTASDAKPFAACKFIRDNKLKGKMFNYWTEGGFIAWGQEPDPNTGRTPLQLFMDGRAQAAYDVKAFDDWTDICSGGPVVRDAQIRGREMSSDDYPEMGRWISEQLRKWNVWVALMPSNQFNKPFVAGLQANPEWPEVFLDNKQKIFIDITTPQGKELFEGIIDGKTIYPDEFTRNLAAGHNLLLYGKDQAIRKQGLDYVIKAFNLNPSPAPLLEVLLIARRWPELASQVDEFCSGYAYSFAKNKEVYSKQDGYNLRLESARLMLIHLQNVAQARGDKKLVEYCVDTRAQYMEERDRISDQKRW